jgi:hypothetical protein
VIDSTRQAVLFVPSRAEAGDGDVAALAPTAMNQ